MDDQRADREGGRIRFRKLRAAWSVACGILCLLLVALWVRSYWRMDWITLYYDSNSFAATSLTGAINFNFQHREAAGRENKFGSRQIPAEDMARYGAFTFLWNTDINLEVLVVPHWFLIAILLLGAVWPTRFSLRTLLIGMTVVAAILGALVWAAK